MLRWPQSVEIKGFFGKKRCMFRTCPARPESVGHDAAPGLGRRGRRRGSRADALCGQVRQALLFRRRLCVLGAEGEHDADHHGGRSEPDEGVARQEEESGAHGEEEDDAHTASVQVEGLACALRAGGKGIYGMWRRCFERRRSSAGRAERAGSSCRRRTGFAIRHRPGLYVYVHGIFSGGKSEKVFLFP